MANINDGTYIILSAKNTSVAIEVIGASDASGANIRLWARNDSDAQKWSTTNYGSAGVQISCALSGRCMEVANNKIQNGTNIRQWEDNDSHAQRWDVVADGQTVTVGGKEYPTYVIKSHGTAFAVDVSGGNAQAGTNIQLYIANGTDAQRWAFIPIETFTNGGTYKIVSAVAEDMVLDVQGASIANGANVMLYPSNVGSNQCWITQKNDDGTITIIGAGSKKALDDKGAGTKPGSNIQIYAPNYGTAQSFLAERLGAMTVAGQIVPTFRLRIQAGSNLALDVQGGSNKPGTNVRLWAANASPAQRFAFVPTTSPADTLPTPAGLSIDSLAGNNKTNVKLSFICDWSNFQARCRFRSRKAGGAMGTWSSWKSATDGLAGNEGWGDAWQATFALDQTIGDTKTATVPIPEDYRIDGTTIVATDMQIEIRSHAGNWQGISGYSVHGASASQTFSLAWRPTVNLDMAKLCGDGLRIYYTSDLADGGCTVTASAYGVTATEKGKWGASGHVLIPCEKLPIVPKKEETTKCSVQITRDFPSEPLIAEKMIAGEAGEVAVSANVSQTDYGTHLLNVGTASADDTVKIFIASKNGVVSSYEKSRDDTSRIFEALSPLHTNITALIWQTQSDGKWRAGTVTLPPVSDHAYSWIYDGGACVLDFGKGEAPSQEDGISRGVEDYEVVSRAYHSYRLHKAKERQLNVSGAVVTTLPKHGSWEAFDALLAAGHAIFRNPRGEIIPVVVTAISRPVAHPGWTEIKVTQRQETR